MDEARLTLYRRFRTADEAREEAETNLSAGSLWVPFEPGAERPALLRAVLVSLVLADGVALEGLRGRVSCVASAGAAIVLDDLPTALVLTRLLGGEMPPPPSASGELAPEDAPPLPAGIPDGWEPVAPPEFDTMPSTQRVDPPPPLREVTPVPDVGLRLVTPPQEAPADDGADYPVPRDSAPVAAVSPEAHMWDEADGLEPALKEAPVAPGEPEEPALPTFTVRYATGPELEKAWKNELGAGRVMVTAADPPALDARVEVTLLLPEVGALMLEGTVVHRTGTGAGILLDLDAVTRALIESALPSNAHQPTPAAAPPEPELAPPPPAAATPPPPKSPTLELRKDASGRAIVVVAFESLADFRREYEMNIRRGGVMVPTTERPPVRSVVEVVFSLLGGKREVKVKGEVVLHGVAGIGVQLGDIPQTTRVEIDSLLAAATPHVAAAPSAPVIAPPPPAAPSRPLAPAPPPASFGAVANDAPPATAPRAMPTAFTPSGNRFEGDLVEVMREAEVEGEAGVGAPIGAKASWLKVLAHLQATRATGVLRAVRKAETKSYLVLQGRILDAKGDPPREDESMFRVIRKHNLAKAGVLRIIEKALERAPDELAALQASNIWTATEIDRARRWQVLERAGEVFAWDKGRFQFDPDGERGWARPTPGVPFGQVILHGVRSYIRASGDDLARILRPGMDRAMRIVSNTGFEPARVGMSDNELRFWAEIDGKKTLRQLLATSPIAVSQTHRLVFALFRLGVLSLDRSASSASKPRESDRIEVLRTRAADMKTRDVFGKLSLSWMCAAPHVQGAWDALRRELDPDMKAGGSVAALAKEILAMGEEAYKLLLDERTRRLQRLKLIEDPARIEAAADMLAERAEVLRMQGDAAGAESAVQMALDMAPRNPAFLQILARVKAR